MKTVLLLLISGSLLLPTLASGVPKDLAPSDWSSIRAAHDAWKHEFRQVDGVWQARNPGQQWTTTFDRRRFFAKPQNADWSWGLELHSYGFPSDPQTITGTAEIKAQGQRLSYHWHGGLEEWFVNDRRGLEHGFIVPERPDGARQGEPLVFTLSTVGGLRPTIAKDALTVHFRDHAGAPVLSYSGLKVWDADGTILESRFERANDGQFSIAVDEAGARYPITIDPIAQQAYLKASNTGADDLFGSAVAASGNTVVVGAPGEASAATGVNGNQADNSASGAGAVYVFVRNGGNWIQQAYLKASNTDAGDYFGYSVALSGDTLVVGAFRERSSATGINGNQADNNAGNAGAAYVFVRNNNVWSQQAYLKASNADAGDEFGYSVAVSEETIVVGAWREQSAATGVNGNQADDSASGCGAAYVFFRSGEIWTQQAYLKASNSLGGNYFGHSVAISNNTVIVGAFGESSTATGVNGNQEQSWRGVESGAAYIFVRDSSTWSQQAYLKASNAGAFDRFGYSVAVSGDKAVVGANQEDSAATGMNGDQENNGYVDSGAAYLFERSNATWSQTAYLKASNTGPQDRFGSSVAMSEDTVAVGAEFEDSNSTGVNSTPNEGSNNNGAAYVFARSQGGWLQQAYLKSNVPNYSGRFGNSIAASEGWVVVGHVFETSSTTGVNNPPLVGSLASAGAAHVFAILSLSSDTDSDGMSDASEYNMAALGFDWTVAQPDLVNTYFQNAAGAGLFTASQVQAMNSGTPLIAKDSATGNFKLTLDWKKSTDLNSFSDFPAPAGSSVFITPQGDVEFEFPAPDDAAFFRIEME